MDTTYFLHNSAYSNQSSAKFQLKLTISNFCTKSAQKAISSKKQKKWTSLWNSAYLNQSRYKISAKLIIVSFWTKFTQKRYFQSKREQAVQGLQVFNFCVVNVNSTVFKHFEDLKDLIFFERKIGYVLPPGLFLS